MSGCLTGWPRKSDALSMCIGLSASLTVCVVCECVCVDSSARSEVFPETVEINVYLHPQE